VHCSSSERFQVNFGQVETTVQMQSPRFIGTGALSGSILEMQTNTTSGFGTLDLRGSRGGWYGISLPQILERPHIMFQSGGNGGFYSETGGRWHHYYNYTNNCVAIIGSTTSSTYELYVTGDIFATGNIVGQSDERKKENIATIDNALDKVLQLRGVTYNKIQTDSEKELKDLKGRTEMGLIAQEVEKIVPEVVFYADDIDEYGINYPNMVGLLVEGIKDQNKLINSQQKQIDELKEMVNKLMEKL
jgi:hypothetical protein